MDQPVTPITQPRGDFIVSPSRYPGKGRPNFTGSITMPGSDTKMRASVWKNEYRDDKTGELITYYSGQTAEYSYNDSIEDQLEKIGSSANGKTLEEANLSVKANRFVIFKNNTKDYSVEKHGEGKPDFWGRWNPGHGDKLVAIGVWARKNKETGQLILSGQTQYPLTKEEVEQMRMSDQQHDALETFGDSKPAAPRRRGGRAA
ncbi:hypothetical protein HYPGJ_31608 [Hyphomicrobium sp. GJ21]|uniref:hypothetical protein n=1 Tax=Hyphomicrobium sp. GJ21 TaxID=113574 RepID=UPI000622C063|nr:hypothetical protein [Hyphomicrobium sp. GJ21]CEJ88120.1 hypothetical protein HYPGJ_31608 [Hyphomicrobium sp. GJ21]